VFKSWKAAKLNWRAPIWLSRHTRLQSIVSINVQALSEMRHNIGGGCRRKTALVIMRKSALLACAIAFADAVGIAAASILLWQNLFHYYTLLTLLQAALLFLYGGARDLSASLAFTRISNRINQTKKPWTFDAHRQAQEKAAPYVLTGIILLGLSFILANPLK
jgi:hypothetical protein